MSIVQAEHLQKTFPMPDGGLKYAVNEVSFSIEAGPDPAGGGKLSHKWVSLWPTVYQSNGLDQTVSRQSQSGLGKAGAESDGPDRNRCRRSD